MKKKIEDMNPTISRATVSLGVNGWVIMVDRSSHLMGETFIANTPQEIGQIFQKFGLKPQHPLKGA